MLNTPPTPGTKTDALSLYQAAVLKLDLPDGPVFAPSWLEYLTLAQQHDTVWLYPPVNDPLARLAHEAARMTAFEGWTHQAHPKFVHVASA